MITSEEWIRLILDTINCGWNWAELTKHPLATYNIITTHSRLPWVLEKLNENPNINADIVNGNQSYPWNGELLSMNLNMDPMVIIDKTHANMKNSDIRTVMTRMSSYNKNLTIDIIDFIHEKYGFNRSYLDWISLSENCSFTWDDIQDTLLMTGYYWNLDHVCLNPNVTVQIANEDSRLKCYKFLAFNKSTNMDDIIDNRGIFKEHDISQNPNIIPAIAYDYKIISKSWHHVFRNSKYLTQDFINDHYDLASAYINEITTNGHLSWSSVSHKMHHKRVNWCGLSYNPTIHMRLINENIGAKFNLGILLMNSGITLNDYIINKDIGWHTPRYRRFISRNPNLTYADIMRYLKRGSGIKWNFDYLSKNTFGAKIN